MAREKISKLIKKSIKDLQKTRKLPKFELPDFQVERPEEKSHGDYATNVAMKIARIAKRNPMMIAKLIVGLLNHITARPLFNKAVIVQPGFINFFLSNEYLQEQVGEILKEGEEFGQLQIGKNKKFQVEFISANPVGPLHIGNGRGAFLGDCLANSLAKAGFRVYREYYINNAKANNQIRELGRTALGRGTTYLTKDLKSKIRKLKPKLKKITDEGDAGYLLAKVIQEENKNFIRKKLKIKFDTWFSEENLYRKSRMKKIYELLKKKKLIYKKEGAEWLKVSSFDAPKDEVIIRQTGEPTYFLSDIIYHQDKFRRGFSKIIDIWGADHQGHVLKMKAAAKMLGFKGDLNILITQIVRLKGEKLSKRKGKIITLVQLVEEVGLDATRFFYLMKSLNTQMEFDIKLAKERSQKSPVYYIQYAHARICSCLKKLRDRPGINKLIKSKNLKLLHHPNELSVIKELIRLPEIIEDIAKDYQVQRIPQYAIELATAFHQFYRDCRVLTEEEDLKEARLALVLATRQVLENTLNLMGISAPERM